jgi:dGTPase
MSESGFKRLLELITQDRLRPSTRGARGILLESESDKGRVINSAAFRRLQQKAQVFPLDPNAAVRTRLTHSIEVSQVGRHLAQKVVEKLGVGSSSPYGTLTAFVNTVESACLLHDIGNPPFGHFGELVIQKWFKQDDEFADLKSFDGNPQGFRFMTFLGGHDEHGLNLTCTLLLATIKYPRTCEQPGSGKAGIFTSDFKTYEAACARVGWTPGRKFPFALLMDTADEIAYSMSDLEDGLEKKILSISDLKSEFGTSLFTDGPVSPFVDFKTKLIVEAVDAAATMFVNNLEGVLVGGQPRLIEKSSSTGGLLEKVRLFAREKLYTNEAAETIELAGRSVIAGILEHFECLFEVKEEDFRRLMEEDRAALKGKGLDLEERLSRRLPRAYRKKYMIGERGAEKLRRAHLIVDYIVGMTDDFALDTYQILQGIKVS